MSIEKIYGVRLVKRMRILMPYLQKAIIEIRGMRIFPHKSLVETGSHYLFSPVFFALLNERARCPSGALFCFILN
ncbi:MAG: hypothetical protein CRN43_03425 [Candidatus Nephrothrix sp. EaCA]|nr:MAG: hypothetical protein CRN43_03425 [Candidatus Nephrothrix sp. EaCA]